MLDRITSAHVAACTLAMMLMATVSRAQIPEGQVRQSRFATRAELEAAARAAEREQHTDEARLLHARLQQGDFQPGDRILLWIELPDASEAPASGAAPTDNGDTIRVRAGQVVQFTTPPNIPDLSLKGVLRSELVDTLTAHLRKYVRNPIVRATPLLRVAVMGAVGRPGWYSTPSDVALADIIMQAGGVTPESNVGKIVIRRAGQEIWTAREVRAALADNRSLDDLHLRAGDEIFIGKKRWDIMTTIQVLAAATGIWVAVLTLRQSRH